MKKRSIVLMLIVFSFFLAGSLHAENYTIYVHGFGTTDFTKFNDTESNSTSNGGYRDTDNHQLGGTTVHVGYKAWNSPTGWSNGEAQKQIYNVMYNRCRAPNNCKVVCHSMGCLAFGYFNARYNRNYTYRVSQVVSLASAEGGSEVASAGVGIIKAVGGYLGGLIGGALAEMAAKNWMGAIYGLQVSRARDAYNHNDAHHSSFYHYAGHKGSLLSWMLPGEDDFIVSFHSTCSYRKAWAFNNCSSSRYDTDWKHRQVKWNRKCKGRSWWKVCWKYPTWNAIKVYMHSNHYKAPSTGHSGVNANHSETSDRSSYHKL